MVMIDGLVGSISKNLDLLSKFLKIILKSEPKQVIPLETSDKVMAR